MSGSVLADILIPVVALVALAVFIGLVMYASRSPSGKDGSRRSRWTVSGGTFLGDPRQQMPRRDAAPPESLAREGGTAGGSRPRG